MKVRSLFDIGSLLRFEEKAAPIKVKVRIESFELGGEEIDITRPVDFEGSATRLSKGVQVEGEFNAEILLVCSRCLEKFKLSIEGELSELFVLPQYQAQLPDDLDYYLIEGEKIDLEPMIKEQIVLSVPFKALCSENCSGLCPLCGKNLNQGSCSCQKKELKVKSSALKKR